MPKIKLKQITLTVNDETVKKYKKILEYYKDKNNLLYRYEINEIIFDKILKEIGNGKRKK